MHRTVIAAALGIIIGGAVVNYARRYEFKTKFAESDKKFDELNLHNAFYRWVITNEPYMTPDDFKRELIEYKRFIAQVVK